VSARSRTQLPGLKPIFRISLNEEEQKGREMSKAIRIADKTGDSGPPANMRSSIVYYLRSMSLDKVRIYTIEKFRNALRRP